MNAKKGTKKTVAKKKSAATKKATKKASTKKVAKKSAGKVTKKSTEASSKKEPARDPLNHASQQSPEMISPAVLSPAEPPSPEQPSPEQPPSQKEHPPVESEETPAKDPRRGSILVLTDSSNWRPPFESPSKEVIQQLTEIFRSFHHVFIALDRVGSFQKENLPDPLVFHEPISDGGLFQMRRLLDLSWPAGAEEPYPGIIPEVDPFQDFFEFFTEDVSSSIRYPELILHLREKLMVLGRLHDYLKDTATPHFQGAFGVPLVLASFKPHSGSLLERDRISFLKKRIGAWNKSVLEGVLHPPFGRGERISLHDYSVDFAFSSGVYDVSVLFRLQKRRAHFTQIRKTIQDSRYLPKTIEIESISSEQTGSSKEIHP